MSRAWVWPGRVFLHLVLGLVSLLSGCDESTQMATTTCSPGDLVCADVCVDTMSDQANCGACGVVCGGDSVCTGGACTACDAGEEVCGNACVDTQYDVDHCGACDDACDADQACIAGSCRNGCSTGADCTSGICAGGVCVPPTCDDGVANGDETGVDCGGSCPACMGYFETCADIKADDPSSKSGYYTLYVNADPTMPYTAFCQMGAEPGAYLDVDADLNYSTLRTFVSASLVFRTTSYSRVRLIENVLEIDASDATFASTSQSGTPAFVTAANDMNTVPLGFAAARGTYAGASIYIGDTPFRFDLTPIDLNGGVHGEAAGLVDLFADAVGITGSDVIANVVGVGPSGTMGLGTGTIPLYYQGN